MPSAQVSAADGGLTFNGSLFIFGRTMIQSADELQPDTNLDADICIVGAGAAGITLALELSRMAPSLRVLLLDGGIDPQRNLTAPDADPHPAGCQNDWGMEKRVDPSQFLYEGQMEGDMNIIRRHFLTQTRSRSSGGSTNCWGGWCRPLDRSDFEGHGRYEGWPITWDELLPFYKRAQEVCFLDQFEYDDPDYWIQRAARGGVELGVIPDSPGDTLRTVCIQRIRIEKRSFFENYRDRLASSPGVQMVLNANLLRIETAEGERVTRLRLATLAPDRKPGGAFTATAGRFVLALGGIETVRALLLSPSPLQPYGLGNNRDLVGRYFNIHPVVTGAARVTFGASKWAQSVRDFYAQETDFYELARLPRSTDETRPVVTHGQEVEAYEAHAVNTQVEAGPRATPRTHTRVWAILTPTVGTLCREGVGNFRVILRGSLYSADVDVNWEQTSERRNRVTLAKSDRDVFGLPKPRLEWYIHEPDVNTYARALSLTEQKLDAAGYLRRGGSFRRLFDMRNRSTWRENLPNPGDHHMGGTRMASDPARGVVNRDARLHDVANLYVSSCSVWPSGGWANPTLTIVAMAVRLAHHLASSSDQGAIHAIRIAETTLPSLQPEEDAS